MTHNDFHNIHEDLMVPIRDFLVDNDINPSSASCTRAPNLELPYCKVPQEIYNLLYNKVATFDVSRLQQSPRKIKQSMDETVLLETHITAISSE